MKHCKGRCLDVADLPFDVEPIHPRGPEIPGASLAEIERYAIETTLAASRGEVAQAAAVLGLSVDALQSRLAAYARSAYRE